MGYFKKITKAGRTKEIFKSFTKQESKKVRGKKIEVTPEQIAKINELNAQRKLTLKINANFTEGDLFITLTYTKEKRQSPAEAKKSIKDFLDDLRKVYKKKKQKFKYIQVTEYKNKAIHHHLIINDIEEVNIAKEVRKLWQFGRPTFKLLDETGQYKDLAAYLIKETSETFKENESGHKQRYSCSRNLVTPKPEIKIIKANKWSQDPKSEKGYYIDQDTIYNAINPFTGRLIQRYTMIEIPVKISVDK